MADLYWVAFRLEQNATRQRRYDDLMEALVGAATGGKHWKDPTSFVLFRSGLKIDKIATLVKRAIDEDSDIAVIGKPDYKAARVVGMVEDEDLFDLWDWIKIA